MPRILPPQFTLPAPLLSRRSLIAGALGFAANVALGGAAWPAQTPGFARWVEGFRARALNRGISEQTYNRVMHAVTPDSSVYAAVSARPRSGPST